MKPYAIPRDPGLVVYDAGLKDDPEMADLAQQLEDLEKEFVVREIDITFKEKKLFDKTVLSSSDAYRFIRDIIFEGMEVQEHFVVLYTNQSNQIIGYYRHSKGTINSTQVDIQLVMAVALKTLSKGMIVSHNHPSGSLRPSEADRRMTRVLKEAAQVFSIVLLDHIIATANGYYSFADSGESSLSGPGEEQPEVPVHILVGNVDALTAQHGGAAHRCRLHRVAEGVGHHPWQVHPFSVVVEEAVSDGEDVAVACDGGLLVIR